MTGMCDKITSCSFSLSLSFYRLNLSDDEQTTRLDHIAVLNATQERLLRKVQRMNKAANEANKAVQAEIETKKTWLTARSACEESKEDYVRSVASGQLKSVEIMNLDVLCLGYVKCL